MNTNIKRIREEQGISQKELAKMVNISIWWLNDIENNRRKAGIKTLVRIAKALDVPLQKILE